MPLSRRLYCLIVWVILSLYGIVPTCAAQSGTAPVPDARSRVMFETDRGAVFSHTQSSDARFDDPWLGRQVSACRKIADEAQLGQEQRSGALRTDQLPARIQLEPGQQRAVRGDFTRLHPASDDDAVGFGRKANRLLAPNRNAVHRRHLLGR
jgi:hypothetical protein